MKIDPRLKPSWKMATVVLSVLLAIVVYDAYLSKPKSFEECVIEKSKGMSDMGTRMAMLECRKIFPR